MFRLKAADYSDNSVKVSSVNQNYTFSWKLHDLILWLWTVNSCSDQNGDPTYVGASVMCSHGRHCVINHLKTARGSHLRPVGVTDPDATWISNICPRFFSGHISSHAFFAYNFLQKRDRVTRMASLSISSRICILTFVGHHLILR